MKNPLGPQEPHSRREFPLRDSVRTLFPASLPRAEIPRLNLPTVTRPRNVAFIDNAGDVSRARLIFQADDIGQTVSNSARVILSTPSEGRTGRRIGTPMGNSGDSETNEGNEIDPDRRSRGRSLAGQRKATFTDGHGLDEL
jgi:hypothetical protein